MAHETPAEPGATAGKRAPASGTAAPALAGDTHVAGPPPNPTEAGAEGGRDTAPDLVVPKPAPAGPPGRLLDPAEAGRFRERWHRVQAGFVDDPAEAVRKADGLAEEIAEALARSLAEHRRRLSEPLGSGADGKPDTERLRLALRSYRSLLDHVLET